MSRQPEQKDTPGRAGTQTEGNATVTTTEETMNKNTLPTATSTASTEAEQEAQAWFDAHPNAKNVSASEVIRSNPESVWKLIFDRFDEMHEIACAKRAAQGKNATVTTAAGSVVKPESLLMKSLSNGDNTRDIDRGRYFVTAGV